MIVENALIACWHRNDAQSDAKSAVAAMADRMDRFAPMHLWRRWESRIASKSITPAGKLFASPSRCEPRKRKSQEKGWV